MKNFCFLRLHSQIYTISFWVRKATAAENISLNVSFHHSGILGKYYSGKENEGLKMMEKAAKGGLVKVSSYFPHLFMHVLLINLFMST